MSKLFELVLDIFARNKKLAPILIGLAVLVAGFWGLHELKRDPSLGETLWSPAFRILCVVVVSATVIAWSVRSRRPRHAAARRTLQIVASTAVVGYLILFGYHLRDEGKPFRLRVVLWGPQALNYPALNEIISSQMPRKIFRVKLIDRTFESIEAFGSNYDALLDTAEGFREEKPNKDEFTATIVVVNSPLEGNILGAARPEKNIAIVTTADFPQAAPRPSMYEYTLNQSFQWAIFCGTGDQITYIHKPNEDELCLFDYHRQKAALDSQIRKPRFCSAHEAVLIANYERPLFDEYLNIIKMGWLRKPAVRKYLYDLYQIEISEPLP